MTPFVMIFCTLYSAVDIVNCPTPKRRVFHAIDELGLLVLGGEEWLGSRGKCVKTRFRLFGLLCG